jgi:hypothetical protein
LHSIVSILNNLILDNPSHGTFILGGMWGFFNYRDRAKANLIFDRIIHPLIGVNLNPNHSNPKGYDQQFLSDYVYPEIKKNSIIHDSYFCLTLNDSEPFPTKRFGNCFVGTLQYVCENKKPYFSPCPVQCRPYDHQDWTYC